MAAVASNSPFSFRQELVPLPRASPRIPLRQRLFGSSRSLRRLSCEASSNPTETEPPVNPPSTKNELIVQPDLVNDNSQAASVPQSAEFEAYPNKSINRRIALASTFAGVGLFLSSRLDFGVSLKDLSAAAIPYEEALSNGLPTVVEFYADWCEVCRELAPDVYNVEQQYKGRVNFVVLNVDNTKWEQELDEFGVEGIPHFAFLDRDGNEEGNLVGRLPKKYLLDNVAALANGDPEIPYARAVGQYSSAESRKVHQVVAPRAHG